MRINILFNNKFGALFFIYFSEFVARACFWGTASLLILYLSKVIGLSSQNASSIVSGYLSLGFIFSVFGGYLGDKLIHKRFVVLAGICFLIFGFSLMLLDKQSIYPLNLIILGAGLIYPNAPTLLADSAREYKLDKDKIFYAFYAFSNAGVVAAPIAYGLLWEKLGWSDVVWCNLGLLLAWALTCAIQLTGLRAPKASTLKSILLLIAAIFLGFLYLELSSIRYICSAAIWVGYVFFIIRTLKADNISKETLLSCLGLLVLIIIFFTAEFQVAESFVSFFNQFVRAKIMGIEIPSSVSVSFESMFVIIGAPIMLLMMKLLRINKKPTIYKMTLGITTAAVGFAILSFLIYRMIQHHSSSTSIWPILLVNLFIGFGEIVVMPSFLTYLSEVIPENIESRIMAGVYFALSLSGMLSSVVSNSFMGGSTEHLKDYFHGFTVVTVILLISAVLALGTYKIFTSKILRGN